MGGILMLAGLMLLSTVREVWQFYAVFGIVLAAAVSMTHFVPNTALVRKWFIAKAGLATGLVTVGTVTGFACLPPAISRMSAELGWRYATFFCALGFGASILLVALLVIRNTPESMGLLPDGHKPLTGDSGGGGEAGNDRGTALTTRQALRTQNFWSFFVAYSVIGIPMQGALAHIIIWGVDLGYSPANSGLIMAALTIPSIPVRIIAGWMGDRFGKRLVLVLFSLAAALVWFAGWFFVKDRSTFLVFVILLGFAYSAPFSLYTPFLGDLFGRTIVGTLMGILTLGHGIIGGIGPYLWGWIADTTGSYILNCPISAVCYALVVVALYLLKPSSRPT
jgi:MFS family permease